MAFEHTIFSEGFGKRNDRLKLIDLILDGLCNRHDVLELDLKVLCVLTEEPDTLRHVLKTHFKRVYQFIGL